MYRHMNMFSVLLLLLTFAQQALCASQIALFADTNCQESLRGLEGPNGYPNGTCTDLRRSGPYGSFQVVGLDPGCTVTIYVNDTSVDMCSGYQEEIGLISCYNSTFVYYSFDFCDPGAAQSPFPKPRRRRSSTGAIVGGVVGGVLALGIILGIVIFMVRRKRMRNMGAPQASSMAGTNAFGYPPQELQGNMMSYKHTAAEVEQPPVELAGHEMKYDGRR